MKNAICLLPQVSGVGGPVSFAGRLRQGLASRGVPVCEDVLDPSCRAVLVIGGTRRLDTLFLAKRRGVRIVQRLNGMNWLHRKTNTGRGHYLRSELKNWLLATIRGSLADAVVYQSQFARNWWQTVHGFTRAPSQVIYNGVDLKTFSPDGPEERPGDHYRLLMVEGHVAGGYELGLETAIRLVEELNRFTTPAPRLVVAGEVDAKLQAYWTQKAGELVEWRGVVPRDQIPALDRSAHLLFSADLNAACPNSVIEALACGLPVVAFATGSLPELIENDAGRVVPYGSNYWNLETPDVAALAAAAAHILTNQRGYRHAARAHAEAHFGVDKMVNGYLAALEAD